MKAMKDEEREALSSPTDLQQASRLINSLISSSYAVRSFPVKWHSIRGKLEKLNSSLTATVTDPTHNSELDELLQDITAMVEQARSLADRCCDEYYNGGKLQLRSDLDVIISRFDLYLKRFDKLCALGTVTHSRAIILSRPVVGASRDDMRLYVKDLFSRLRVGGSELRARALVTLNEILLEDEKYVSIVASDTADGVTLLVSLLEFRDIQEKVLEAIAMIAGFESYRGVLATAGAIGPLIRVLETENELGKERAARALKRMTVNSDNCWSVSSQGGVTTLIKICSCGNSSKELISSALAVLKNISVVDEIRRFMVEEGAILVLAKLLQSEDEVNQIQIIDFLATLSSGDESIKQRVLREKVVESLIYVLDPNSHHLSKAREVALQAIDILCFSSANSVNVLISSGFLERLLFFIRNGEISVKETALNSVARLCLVSEEAKKAIGDVGFMPELVTLLEMGSFDVREMAAEALSRLVSVQKNRRRFVRDEHNVDRILQLLDPGEKKPVAAKKFLLSALLALTDSSNGRKKIVASSYVKNLKKLAEDDVVDAKKIVKKLASNRFRIILYGIWSS